jgi:hypothetical protein
MNIISANEARQISEDSLTVSRHLSFIGSKIKEEAEKGKLAVVLESAPYDTWAHTMMSEDNRVRDEVIKYLTKLGYRVISVFDTNTLKTGLRITWFMARVEEGLNL